MKERLRERKMERDKRKEVKNKYFVVCYTQVIVVSRLSYTPYSSMNDVECNVMLHGIFHKHIKFTT